MIATPRTRANVMLSVAHYRIRCFEGDVGDWACLDPRDHDDGPIARVLAVWEPGGRSGSALGRRRDAEPGCEKGIR